MRRVAPNRSTAAAGLRRAQCDVARTYPEHRGVTTVWPQPRGTVLCWPSKETYAHEEGGKEAAPALVHVHVHTSMDAHKG
eukprot:1157624-Pelagomonas_calceolata.AAC.1